MQITKEYLIKLGFIQDEESPSYYNYNGISYNLTDDRDISEVKCIIDEINWKIDNEGKELQSKSNEAKKEEEIKKILCTHPSMRNYTSGSEFHTVCLVNCMGNFNKKEDGKDMEIYVYKKDIKEQLEEFKKQGIKVPTERTVYSHLKKLSKIFFDNSDIPLVKMENSNHGIVYKIPQSYDGKYFVTVPYEQLKELLSYTNTEVVKLYCIFCYKCSDEWVKITNSYLCQGLGKDDTLANRNYISGMISVLLKLGHIKCEYESYSELNDKGEEVIKTYNYYKLTTFEEWKEKKEKCRTKRTKK